MRAIRLATLDDLAKAPGMNKKAAQQVVAYFTAVTAAENEPVDASIDPIAEPDVEQGLDPIVEPVYEGDDSDRLGQPDPERGAGADHGLGDDRAAVTSHDAVDHRET